MNKNVCKTMLYLLKILWNEEPKVFFTLWFHIICGAIVPFIGVLIPSVIINQLVNQPTLSRFMLVVGGLLLLYGMIQGILSYLIDYNAFAFIKLRGRRFITEAFLSRAHLDYQQLEDSEYKSILEDGLDAVYSNNEGVEGMYHRFIDFGIAFLGLALYVITSGGLSIWLVLGLLILVIIQYGCFAIARKYEFSHRDTYEAYMVKAKYLNNIAYDIPAGKDIRLFQLQGWINDKFTAVNRLISNIRTKDYRAYMMSDMVSIILDLFRDIVCYIFLIFQLTEGMPIDQFVFYLGIVSGFSLWFKKIGESYGRLSTDNMKTNRMFHALGLKNIMHHGTGEKLDSNEITIEFDHVSFTYPKQNRKILDDVSFTMNAGDKFALVGINGAGKSTIVRLILGFYVPDTGSVKINGIDTRDLDLNDAYHYISGMFQDSAILSYTIMENVSMRNLAKSDRDKVCDCLKRVGLWEYVDHLPNKEFTYLYKDIEKSGMQLSGGQVQKLLLARALYQDAGCILLDEPTAALDALAEKAMYESYGDIMKDKTSLFISHRLSSTKFCDKILVLDQGSIMEEGTHDTLLAHNGVYTHMFEVQSKYYEEEGEENESIL